MSRGLPLYNQDTRRTQRQEFLFADIVPRQDMELFNAFWPFHSIDEERQDVTSMRRWIDCDESVRQRGWSATNDAEEPAGCVTQ